MDSKEDKKRHKLLRQIPPDVISSARSHGHILIPKEGGGFTTVKPRRGRKRGPTLGTGFDKKGDPASKAKTVPAPGRKKIKTTSRRKRTTGAKPIPFFIRGD